MTKEKGKRTTSSKNSPEKAVTAARKKPSRFVTVGEGPRAVRLEFTAEEFPRGTPLPMITVDRKVRVHIPVSGQQPGSKGVARLPSRPVNLNNREANSAWNKSLPRANGKLIPPPAPEPKSRQQQEKWLLLEIPEVAFEAGAWQNFPHLWPVLVVYPQLYPQPFKISVRDKEVGWVTADSDGNWTYIQLPFHYDASHYEDWREKRGRWIENYPADFADRRTGKVDRGIWVPNFLLRPIPLEMAYEKFVGLFQIMFGVQCNWPPSYLNVFTRMPDSENPLYPKLDSH